MYENNTKRQKPNILLERIKRLDTRGYFDTVTISTEGYGTFYDSPKEVEKWLRQAKLYKLLADKTRSIECVGLQLKSLLLYIKAHTTAKKQLNDYLVTANYIIAHINHIKMLCGKYNVCRLIFDLKYAKLILRIDISEKTQLKTKKNGEELKQEFFDNLVKIEKAYKEIANKGYKIITIEFLWETLTELFKEFFS